MARIKYRLYAMETGPEAMSYAAKQRFARITPEYTLIYKRGKCAQGATEVEASDLSTSDSVWLQDCNITILAEETAKNAKETLSRVSDMLTVLENELEKEASANDRNEG